MTVPEYQSAEFENHKTDTDKFDLRQHYIKKNIIRIKKDVASGLAGVIVGVIEKIDLIEESRDIDYIINTVNALNAANISSAIILFGLFKLMQAKINHQKLKQKINTF